MISEKNGIGIILSVFVTSLLIMTLKMIQRYKLDNMNTLYQNCSASALITSDVHVSEQLLTTFTELIVAPSAVL